jgi:hypothetical protein
MLCNGCYAEKPLRFARVVLVADLFGDPAAPP